MAREPSPPGFLRRNDSGVPQPVTMPGMPDDIERDIREAMAHMPEGTHYRGDPYAPKNGDIFADLPALERAIATPTPLDAVARAVRELRFHDAIEFAQGVITKSDALKSIPPHELAAALNGWSLQARTNEGN